MNKDTTLPIPWETAQYLLAAVLDDRFRKLSHKRQRNGIMIAIGMYTGFRPTDVANLQWKSLRGDVIVVFAESKTGKRATRKVHPRLREIFDKYSQKGNWLYDMHPDDYICGQKMKNSRVRYFVKPDSLRQALRLAMQRYIPDWSSEQTSKGMQSLRKTFAVRYMETAEKERQKLANPERAMSGLEQLSDLLNHSDIRITRAYLGLTAKTINNNTMNM